MTQRVLVAGIGNLFLGDDGFGPEVVRRLAGQDGLPDEVRVVDYGIRGMHLAYDLLDGYDALVLVDTLPGEGAPGQGAPGQGAPGQGAPGQGAPGEVTVLQVGEDDLGSGAFDPHGMDPVAVLASLHSLGGTLPPTYVVGCRPLRVEEGIGLSAPVAAAVPRAMAAVRSLLSERVVV